MLESELRRNEDIRVELEERVARLETDLKVSRTDADALRSKLVKSGTRPPAAEESNALYRVTELKFLSLMTGGWDSDPAEGDEGIVVALTPVDEHGDLVKLPGEIEIELLDLTREPDDQRLGFWRLSAQDIRESWHKGVIGSGFVVRLPWQRRPLSEKLVLHARMKTADERRFDATTHLTITPPGVATAERVGKMPPPSKYRVTAQPISTPRREPGDPVDEVPDDEVVEQLPPPPRRLPDDDAEEELGPITIEDRETTDDATADGADEGAIEPGTEVEDSSDQESTTLESDRWTEESIPVLR